MRASLARRWRRPSVCLCSDIDSAGIIRSTRSLHCGERLSARLRLTNHGARIYPFAADVFTFLSNATALPLLPPLVSAIPSQFYSGSKKDASSSDRPTDRPAVLSSLKSQFDFSFLPLLRLGRNSSFTNEMLNYCRGRPSSE